MAPAQFDSTSVEQGCTVALKGHAPHCVGLMPNFSMKTAPPSATLMCFSLRVGCKDARLGG